MAQKIDEKQLRWRKVRTAKLFLGVPYLWGGRSIKPEVRGKRPEVRKNSELETRNPQPDVVRGVDCSGFTNLVFRANNIDIPRNAHVQWMVTPKISHDATQSGDLIFVSNQDEFYKISHVVISLGGDEFIEALETGMVVKINSFRDKFGKTLVELAKQDLVIENKKIYCGKMPVSK
jgi:cell wall-associated NlpC family hydrolase